MFLPDLSKSPRNRYIASATLGYAVFSLVWIFLSDQLLALFTDVSEIVWLSTAKGFAFVVVTSVLLFFALRFVPSAQQLRFSLDSIVSEDEAPLRWPRWAAYTFAVVISAVILWFRLSLPEQAEMRPLVSLFVLPIILSAALGGIGPGLVATVCAAFGVTYFVTIPVHSFQIANKQDQLQLAFLIVNGIVVSALCEILHRALHRLETTRQLQAVTLSSAGDAIITTDKRGTVTLLNPVAEQLTGWSREQATGRTLAGIFVARNAANTPLLEATIKSLLKSGATAQSDQEVVLCHRDGSERFIDLTTAPIRLSDGTTLGVILSFRDVTERRQAERTLRESEARYARVIDGSNQGFWEWNLKTQQFTTSSRFMAMLGYADRDLSIPVERWSDYVHPDDLAQAMISIDRHLRGESELHYIEIRCITVDQKWKWILTQGKIIEREADGTPLLMAGTHTDISERKRNEAALQQAATVFESTREGVLITDADVCIVKVNRAFTQLTGYSEADVLGKKPSLLNSGRNSKEGYAAMWQDINASGYWQGELWNRRKNGEIFPVLISINAVKDGSGKVTNYVGVSMDISTLKASEEKLHFLAHHDALTQLPNRRLLFSQLEHCLAKTRRDERTLGLLMFDLDRFKDVNDSFGHLVGDQLLQLVATRLSERLRGSDIIARLGGDEFTVLLEELARPEDAARVAEDVLDALSTPFHLPNGTDIRTGASIGISFSSGSETTAEALLQQADAAMYRAKSEGRGRFQYFSENMTAAARERIQLDSRLRRALERSEFRVYYQPLIDILSGHIVGAEALVRWQDPDEGLIPPARFIPIAEETGLISQIGEWVLHETCRQGKAWRDAGLPPIVLAVNVSAHQVRHGKLVDTVDRILEETGFSPRSLELELTESSLMEKTTEVIELLNTLRSREIRLAIDDFGTGYSSLAYLKRFPLDVLKIDKSFIDDISHDLDDRKIIKAIIEMGHTLGIKVLAEGVETAEQLDYLRAQGCDMYQGYFRSRPLPADDFAVFLKDAQ